jgi:preprotein translocase subunit SecE
MSDEPKNQKEGSEIKEKNFIQAKFSEYRAEFRKIVWPSRPELIKHTITTIVISLLFGALIAVMDGVLSLVFTTLVNRFSA